MRLVLELSGAFAQKLLIEAAPLANDRFLDARWLRARLSELLVGLAGDVAIPVMRDWRDERIAELEAALAAKDARIAELEQRVAELSKNSWQIAHRVRDQRAQLI